MTIGLILLAIVSVLIFFGATERFFRRLGLPNWLAFLLVLALIVGAIVPSVRIGRFSMNVGGFLIPVIIMVILDVIMGVSPELFRTGIATLAVAAVALGVRVLLRPVNGGMILTSSLIVGFVGGAIAYLIGGTRLSTLSSVMGGIVLGDILTNLVYVFGVGNMSYSLGTRGVFDSIIIASVFGIALYELVAIAKRTAGNKRLKNSSLNFEGGEDVYSEEEFLNMENHYSPEDFDDYFEDVDRFDGNPHIK